MKLLLASGDEYELMDSMKRGSQLIGSSYIDTITVYISEDIETVKTVFSNQDALSLITVINSDKSICGEYHGFQKLVSIGYSPSQREDEKEVYSVTLALTNDMDSLIKTFSANMEKNSIKVNEALDTAIGTKDTVDTVSQKLDSIIGKTSIDEMSVAEAKAFRIKESKETLAEYLQSNPIKSTCHKGKEASYSIVSEKQQYLISMIAIAQLAEASGVEYKPSWNATGEACSYDWTVEELQQLAFEMETVVRPLVSKQQEFEIQISKCKTIDDIKAIAISY